MQKRFAVVLIGILAVFAAGIAGYMTIEGWPFADAIYMVVITLASVGYGEVQPLTPNGRIFTMFLILGGTGMLVYAVSSFTAFIVEGDLTDVLRRKKMQKRIAALKNHYIICGAGLTGRYCVEELHRTQRQFVVIERDAEKIKELIEQGVLCVEGDASHDQTLRQAGIEQAAGLVSALATDAENLFVVFTAKRLKADLRIVSKATEKESEQKLRLAGADGVVSPKSIGGLRMASELIRPTVTGFLDKMLRLQNRTIRVDEIPIAAETCLDGQSLGQSGLLDQRTFSVVAITADGTDSYTFNPPRETVLTAGQTIVVVGDIAAIEAVRTAVCEKKRS